MSNNNFLSYILSFCMALFLTILSLLMLTHFMLFSQSRIYKTFETTNYYENVSLQINQNLQYTSGAAGIDPNIFTMFMDENTVKADIINYMEDTSENSIYQINYANKMNEYLLLKGYAEADINSPEMQEYIRIQAVDYVKQIKFPFMKYFTMAKDTIALTFPYVLSACIIMLLVSIALLKKGLSKTRFYQWVGYGLVGSGGMLIATPIALLITQSIEKINLEPVYYYSFIVRYANEFLWMMILISIVIIIVGVLCVYHSYKIIKSRNLH